MRPSAGPALDLFVLATALGFCLLPYWIPALCGALALLLFLPGQALRRHLDPGHGALTLSGATISCGLSLAITPVALRLAGLFLPFGKPMVLGVLGGFSGALLVGAARRTLRHVPPASAARRGSGGIILVLFLTAALLIPALWIGPVAGGETRIKGWDLHNHQAVSEAIASRGLPPTNPFLDSPSPFYYHTYFHILVAAVQVTAGTGAPAYLLTALLTIAAALLLLAVFHRVLADFTGRPRSALLALPFVSLAGGYDLIPILSRILRSGELASWGEVVSRRWNVDAWISHQKMFIPSFFAQFYWAPHAVAGMAVLLLALYFLEREGTSGWEFAAAAICLAAMAGYNGYVALGGVLTVALLRGTASLGFLVSSLRYRRATLPRSALAGATALVLAWPVLDLYFGERGDVDKFRYLAGGKLLPIQVFLEFGPALILGIGGALLAWRRPPLRKGLLPFLLMGVSALPLICLIASTGENNDLAMRVSMMVWLALAAFAGVALEAAWERRPMRRLALFVLLPGVLGILWFSAGASWGKPVLPGDEVAAGSWIRHHLPPGELVQGSPLRNSPELVYLSGHPAVLSDSWAARLFYSVPADFDRNLQELLEIFTSQDSTFACEELERLGVAALVVGPPETADFPLLARPLPWDCLTTAFQQGDYRVFLVKP